jgi:hypothetical protein
MNTQEADALGHRIADLIAHEQAVKAYSLLSPVLAKRTPFRLLDRVGDAVGAGPVKPVNAFLDLIGDAKTMGGWVIIGSALNGQTAGHLKETLDLCRTHAVFADVWYATDILGERVPGPALLTDFQKTVKHLARWQDDSNRWMRRMIGVAVHFWAKRSRGLPQSVPQAKILLDLLSPMFEEKETDAIKGVGWGLKTMGKYYPDLLSAWLVKQLDRSRPRALMLRKTLTYLPAENRSRITKALS